MYMHDSYERNSNGGRRDQVSTSYYPTLNWAQLAGSSRLALFRCRVLDRDSAVHLKWTGLAALWSFGYLSPTGLGKGTLWHAGEVSLVHSRTHFNAAVTACAPPLRTVRSGVPQTNHHREMKPLSQPKPNADMRSELPGGREAYK